MKLGSRLWGLLYSLFGQPPRHELLSLTGRNVRFEHAQEGPGAELMQEYFRDVLARHACVERAYFCALRYDEERPSPALCLAPELADPSPVFNDLGRTMTAHFTGGFSIDVLVVSMAQERELERVCAPFYERSRP